MSTGRVRDPFPSFNFLVEIDGITRGAFQECTGLDSTIDVIEYREGGENTTVRKMPGITRYSNIQLKWGVVDDTELYDWHHRIVQGTMDRRNGSIVLLNRLGEEVARWDFERAWPTKWDGPDLNAEGTDSAVEALELAHEGVKRA